MALPDDGRCTHTDNQLKAFTVLRYLVLASIVFTRVFKLKGRAVLASQDQGDDEQPREEPFKSNPQFTKYIGWFSGGEFVGGGAFGNALGFVLSMPLALGIFIKTEGVGLVVYFGMSGVMDNVAVFGNHVKYCACTVALSLYSMALVTFLPNCFLAYYLQASMYDEGSWLGNDFLGIFGSKVKFIGIMVVASAIFFLFRLCLVYELGWADLIYHTVGDSVLLAAITPPTVDAIQSSLLIYASLFAKKAAEARGVTPCRTPLLEVEA